GLRDPAAGGPARYLAAAGFAAPAVDPSDTVGRTLTGPATATGAPGGSVELDVNGTRVAAGALEGGGVRPGQLRASFLGRLLRPGGNSISVDLRVEGSAPAGGPPPGPPVFGIGDPLTATISLPSSEPAVPDLRLLPWPFLEGERQADVVLADRSAET